MREPLFLGLWLVPLLALSSLRAAGQRGLGRVVMGLLPKQVIRSGVMVLLLLVALIGWPMMLHPPEPWGCICWRPQRMWGCIG